MEAHNYAVAIAEGITKKLKERRKNCFLRRKGFLPALTPSGDGHENAGSATIAGPKAEINPVETATVTAAGLHLSAHAQLEATLDNANSMRQPERASIIGAEVPVLNTPLEQALESLGAGLGALPAAFPNLRSSPQTTLQSLGAGVSALPVGLGHEKEYFHEPSRSRSIPGPLSGSFSDGFTQSEGRVCDQSPDESVNDQCLTVDLIRMERGTCLY